MSYTRTPALKKVPMMRWSERNDPGPGRFSCRLCAPKRPPRLAKASTGGAGKVPMGTGLASLRASSTHTSLGQSAPLSITHSSLTIHSPRSNSGSSVCVKPLKGGDGFHDDTTLMSDGLAMSSTKAPPSM